MPWIPIFLAAGFYAGTYAQAKGPDVVSLAYAALIGLALLNMWARGKARPS